MEQSTCKDTTTIQFILSFAQKYAQRFIFVRKQHNKYVVEASFCIFSFYFVSFLLAFCQYFGAYLYVCTYNGQLSFYLNIAMALLLLTIQYKWQCFSKHIANVVYLHFPPHNYTHGCAHKRKHYYTFSIQWLIELIRRERMPLKLVPLSLSLLLLLVFKQRKNIRKKNIDSLSN